MDDDTTFLSGAIVGAACMLVIGLFGYFHTCRPGWREEIQKHCGGEWFLNSEHEAEFRFKPCKPSDKT